MKTRSFSATWHLSGLLTLTGRLLQDELSARLGPLGVTHAQAVALVRLWRAPAGRLPQSELARSLALSRPSTALVLNALEDKGLVVRHRDDRDGRRLLVELTRAGWALEAPAAAAFDDVEGLILDGSDPAAVASATDLLREVLGRTRSLRPD